jgi:hypothetical protein
VRTKINNGEASEYVTRRQAFRGNNMYGEWGYSPDADVPAEQAKIYAVYSYGTHWPLFVYDPMNEQWYENNSGYDWRDGRRHSNTFNGGSGRRSANKFSPTTLRHHREARPSAETTLCDVEDLKRLVKSGVVGWVQWKLRGETQTKFLS